MLLQERKYAEKDDQSRFIPTSLGSKMTYVADFAHSHHYDHYWYYDTGIALVEGYNNMGYQLNKPHLRAAMEKDCVKVSK